jgi:hypothetical protein
MKQIRTIFLVTLMCLLVTGVSLVKAQTIPSYDIPEMSTWTMSMGVGGGGPGLGDVLISPLYDVRTITDSNLPGSLATASQQQYTMFSIVNTDRTYGVIALLRFREWKRSREVLDISIPLTTNDVWVGEVYKRSGGGGALRSPDRYMSAFPSPDLMNDCFPTAVINAVDFGLGVGNGIDFRTYDLESGLSDAEKLARTEYGYFEIIGMERVGAPNASWCFPRVGTWPEPSPSRDVRNVLMGNTFIIRPDQAISHQFAMTALANFAIDNDGIFRVSTTSGITLTNLLNDVQGENTALVPPGIGGFDQLEFILSKRYVRFQYVVGLDSLNTPQSTSVVVTFPTKHFHYTKTSPFPIVTAYPWPRPFSGAYETIGDGTAYGEIFYYYIYDRSENTFSTPTLPPISPPPPTTPSIPRLPYEVNIIGLYPSISLPTSYFRNNVLISTGTSSTTPFLAGYAWLDLAPDLFTTGETRPYIQGENFAYGGNPWYFNFFGRDFSDYRGLPAIGIVMTEFYNDTVNGYYGNTIPWRYNVDWTPLALII